jgi:hypothetical protein
VLSRDGGATVEFGAADDRRKVWVAPFGRLGLLIAN